ncbi:hypothetical protein [Limosilactobacillus reuteri]|uniref:Uncharacterized protein n=1 Tax=Limosilactobacillus reuteri TaxID=1598 RepID=A0AAX2SRU4_LIMRT|nr:hypothetical protein [Limosilactobacillus reuteri]RMX27489.1 hypothetical protein C6H63_05815 [Limosilactobacillus reuteri]TGB09834.1 hypothetical protein E5F87_09355 [Limosilactobacillus reuteri]
MKIDEFINSIRNFDKRLNVYQYPKSLWVTYNSRTFVKVPLNAKTIFDCRINDELEELTDGIKITVSNKINKFLRTPIKERFPEKKYRLRWINDNCGATNYVIFRDYSVWDFVENEKYMATIFTESELEQLKKDNPRFAPAIDAMKELVEVKNND